MMPSGLRTRASTYSSSILMCRKTVAEISYVPKCYLTYLAIVLPMRRTDEPRHEWRESCNFDVMGQSTRATPIEGYKTCSPGNSSIPLVDGSCLCSRPGR